LAWNQITDCSSVVVAVVDSGVNYNHQDLSANMWNGGATYPNHGYNFTTEGASTDPMDLLGHGTHVAGIIGAVGNNAIGTSGVCWKASIMALRAMDSTGTGFTSTIISAINFAVTNGAKVINLSLGGGGTLDPAYNNAITNALNNDVVVVVAAGNETTNNDLAGKASYPCNFTQANLICVAALDQNDALADFSNWGSTSVDVGAPGTNILSTWAGTSASLTDTMDGMTFGWSVPIGVSGFTFGQATPGTFPYNQGVYKSLNFPGVANWPTGFAPANTNARIWTVLNLSSFDAVTLDVFGASHVVSDGGANGAAMAYSVAGTDPFAGTPTYFSGTSLAATETTPATVPVFSAIPTLSLAGCNKSVNCAIGFQLKTGATTTNLGMSVVGFTVNTLALNNTTYKLENGTSMATPAVAGLATMLRAYNPQYTANDVVSSIKNSGRAVASLSGKTTTGRAVDAMKSLAHINTPAGLAATVQ
jgi:subtilisin family serine protease